MPDEQHPIAREWVATGQLQHVEDGHIDRIPPFDKRTGEHYWIMMISYKVDPAKATDPTATPILDRENLVMVTGPGCYYCELTYTQLIARRRCRGRGVHTGEVK